MGTGNNESSSLNTKMIEGLILSAVEKMDKCFGVLSSVRNDSGEIIDFVVEYLNEAACKSHLILGEGFTGKRMLQISPAHVGEWFFHKFKEAVQAGISIKETYTYDDSHLQQRVKIEYRVLKTESTDSIAVVWDITPYRYFENSALFEINTLFSKTADDCPILIWMSDMDGRIRFCNKKWQEFTGRKMEPGSETGWIEGFHPDDLQSFLNTYSTAYGKREKFSTEFRLKDAKGEYRQIICTGTPIPFEDGSFKVYMGFCMDATELKNIKAHEEILINEKSEDKKLIEGLMTDLQNNDFILRALLDIIPVGVVIVDKNGEVIINNSMHREIVGGASARSIYDEKKPYLFYYLDGSPFPIDDLPMSLSLKNGTLVRDKEFIFYNASGTQMYIAISSSPIYDSDGGIMGAIATVTDITSRKRTEEALRESEESFRSAFENTTIGKALVTKDGRVLRVNHALCEMLGYSWEELSFINYYDLIYPDDLLVRDIVMEDGKENLFVELRCIHKQGHVIWVHINVSSVRSSEKQLLYYVVQLQDIMPKASLDEAITIQKTILETDFEYVPNIRIKADYLPAKRVGGDLYGIYKSNDNVLIFIADICGQGVGAAITSSYFKACMDHLVYDDRIINPDTVVSRIKDIVCREKVFKNKFLTLFVCCIDINTLYMKYCNAGHCQPAIGRNGITFFLDPSQKFISDFDKEVGYASNGMQLEEGDKILLYTDGIFEWRGREGFFGIVKFQQYIKQNDLFESTIRSLIEKSTEVFENTDDISYVLINIGNRYERKFSSCPGNLDKVMDWFTEIINDRLKKDKYSSRIKQCFDEMVVNAFEHGSRFDETKTVTAAVNFTDEHIEFTVADQGEGFDWEKVFANFCNAAGTVRGKGIYITSHFADKVLYTDKGNEVKVIFIKGGYNLC